MKQVRKGRKERVKLKSEVAENNYVDVSIHENTIKKTNLESRKKPN